MYRPSLAAQIREALTTPWSAERVRSHCWALIIGEQVKGTERNHTSWLFRTVPTEHKDREELADKVREFTCEAVNMYDHTRRASFNTFLTTHLRLRCGNYQQYLWVRSSGNEKCRKLPIVELQNNEHDTPRHPAVIDGGRTLELSAPGSAERSAQIRELLAALPEEDQATVRELLTAGKTSPSKLARLLKTLRKLAAHYV